LHLTAEWFERAAHRRVMFEAKDPIRVRNEQKAMGCLILEPPGLPIRKALSSASV
jgi:hypothetical protein